VRFEAGLSNSRMGDNCQKAFRILGTVGWDFPDEYGQICVDEERDTARAASR
jgi:hypothetical protein